MTREQEAAFDKIVNPCWSYNAHMAAIEAFQAGLECAEKASKKHYRAEIKRLTNALIEITEVSLAGFDKDGAFKIDGPIPGMCPTYCDWLRKARAKGVV